MKDQEQKLREIIFVIEIRKCKKIKRRYSTHLLMQQWSATAAFRLPIFRHNHLQQISIWHPSASFSMNSGVSLINNFLWYTGVAIISLTIVFSHCNSSSFLERDEHIVTLWSCSDTDFVQSALEFKFNCLKICKYVMMKLNHLRQNV